MRVNAEGSSEIEEIISPPGLFNIGAKVNIQVEYFILNSPGGEIISSIS